MKQMKENLEHPCKLFTGHGWDEAMRVRLTMATIKTLYGIDSELDAQRERDPSLGPRLLEIGVATLTDSTLDQEVKRLEKVPQVVTAARNRGLTVRQYLTTKLSFVATLFIGVMASSDPAGMERLKADRCDVDNVQFFLDHEDEIMKLVPQ